MAAEGDAVPHRVTAGVPNRLATRARRGVTRVEPGEAAKVWINLPAGDGGGELRGRTITVRARVAPPRAGATVRFLVTQDELRTCEGKPFELPAANRASIVATAETNGRGVAAARLTLSTYGGDVFRVGATLRAGASRAFADADAAWRDAELAGAPAAERDELRQARTRAAAPLTWSGPLTVWRRLTYRLDYMQRFGGTGRTYADLCEPVLQAWRDELAKAFVRLEEGLPSETLVFREGVRELDPATLERVEHGPPADPPPGPPPIHMAFVDSLVTARRVEETRAYRFPDGSVREGVELCPRGDVWLDPDDWLAKVEVWASSGEGRLKTLSPEAARESVRLRASADAWLLDLEFPDDLWLFRAFVELRVTYRGFSTGSGSIPLGGTGGVIGVAWREAAFATARQRRTSVLKTLIHEVGHVLGLAAKVSPDEAATNRYVGDGRKGTHALPTYYHNGHHCSREWGGDGAGCVMWQDNCWTRAGAPVFPLELCDLCQVHLRGRVLSGLPVSHGDGFAAAGYAP